MVLNPLTLPQITALDHVFFPASQPSGRLVIVLHGLGDSVEGFTWMPEAMALPQVDYLLVNAPHPYFSGYAWYDIEDPKPGVEQGRELLRKLFAELAGPGGWKSENIVLFGFSQGCLMTIDFALRHPEPLAGVVGISGYALLGDNLKKEIHPTARTQNWLITHGEFDPMLPMERTHGQMETLRSHGIPIQWHEFPKDHTIDFERELPLLQQWIGECWDQ